MSKEKKDTMMKIIRRTEENILQSQDPELETDLVKDQEIEMIDQGKEELAPETRELQVPVIDPEIYLEKGLELEIYLVIGLDLCLEIYLGIDREIGFIEILVQEAVEWAEEIPIEEGTPVPDIDLIETGM